MYFGLQSGGLGILNLENRRLVHKDEIIRQTAQTIEKRIILTAITLCADDKEEILYFGTKDELLKYDIKQKQIKWAIKLPTMPGSGAPVVDYNGAVLFRLAQKCTSRVRLCFETQIVRQRF